MKEKLLKAVDLVVGDTWPKRRVVVWAILIFCAQLIAICLWAAIDRLDSSLIREISSNAFWLGGTMGLTYVFGSVWDNIDKRKHLNKVGDTPAESPPQEGE